MHSRSKSIPPYRSAENDGIILIQIYIYRFKLWTITAVYFILSLIYNLIVVGAVWNNGFNAKNIAAYGCSLGGSLVSLLVGRQNIHIDHAIIGSSDMDQAPKWLAKIETAIMIPLFYPFITGKNDCFLSRKMDKRLQQGGESAEYTKKILKIMGVGSGIDLSFISKESMKNQFCTDLYTKVGEKIHVPGTTIHVFYAKKMGEKYLDRYLK